MIDPPPKPAPTVPSRPVQIPSLQAFLATCRAAVDAQRRLFAEHAGIGARTRYDGVGEGGDRTLLLDRLCEQALLEQAERLHRAGHEFTVITEEAGEIPFGDTAAPGRLVVDPIDGSVNVRRTIPAHALSVAYATGSTMADVELAFVHDFGAGEEFIAERDGGARLDSEQLIAPQGRGLELVGLEAPKPERVVPIAERLAGRVHRFRAPGSIAISLVYVAAGRYDGMLSTRPTRSVDSAAGQLIVREAGAAVAFEDLGLQGAGLGLECRYQVAAARDSDDLEVLLDAQAAVQGAEAAG